eukprot:1506484-Rhodomonas_salina.1
MALRLVHLATYVSVEQYKPTSIVLRISYEMSGTDLGMPAPPPLWSYGAVMRCPVLTKSDVRERYAMSGTDTRNSAVLSRRGRGQGASGRYQPT